MVPNVDVGKIFESKCVDKSVIHTSTKLLNYKIFNSLMKLCTIRTLITKCITTYIATYVHTNTPLNTLA